MAGEVIQIDGTGTGTQGPRPLPKPPWIRVRLKTSPEVQQVRALMRRLDLHTVCEEAACPNIGECWAERHATVMILGSTSAIFLSTASFWVPSAGRPLSKRP